MTDTAESVRRQKCRLCFTLQYIWTLFVLVLFKLVHSLLSSKNNLQIILQRSVYVASRNSSASQTSKHHCFVRTSGANLT